MIKTFALPLDGAGMSAFFAAVVVLFSVFLYGVLARIAGGAPGRDADVGSRIPPPHCFAGRIQEMHGDVPRGRPRSGQPICRCDGDAGGASAADGRILAGARELLRAIRDRSRQPAVLTLDGHALPSVVGTASAMTVRCRTCDSCAA